MEVNPLAPFLVIDLGSHAVCQPLLTVAKKRTGFCMKKRTGSLVVIIPILAGLFLAGCTENSGWQVGPEGIPLNSAPNGSSSSTSR
jgi:hypothetical protein